MTCWGGKLAQHGIYLPNVKHTHTQTHTARNIFFVFYGFLMIHENAARTISW